MFTARYGLIPYIKQITFRLYKANEARTFKLRAEGYFCDVIGLVNRSQQRQSTSYQPLHLWLPYAFTCTGSIFRCHLIFQWNSMGSCGLSTCM